MRDKTIRYLIAGQTVLWLGLFMSFLLSPGIVLTNMGVSNFGVHARTVLPYGVGFLGCGYLTLMAAHAITRNNPDAIRLVRALSLLALFVLGVLLTPYSISTLFDWSHRIVGGTLFLFELVLAGWFVSVRADWLDWILFAGQCLGSALAALSLMNIFALMFTGQLIAQLAFGILLIRTTSRILSY